MRGIRRLVVYGAVTGLLTAGAVTASMEVAHANFSDLCDGSSTDSYACTLTTSSTIPDPSSISVTLSVAANEEIQVSWTVSCTDNNGPAERRVVTPTRSPPRPRMSKTSRSPSPPTASAT